MLSAMDRSLSGLIARQAMIDVAADNIANINTTAFKKNEAIFGELLYDSLRVRRGPVIGGETVQSGRGVKIAALTKNQLQGSLSPSESRTNLAIQGKGFFRVSDGRGNVFYTRAGTFQLDSEGNFVTPGGEYLEPRLELDVEKIDPRSLRISPAGQVSGLSYDGEDVSLGKISLYYFTNSAALRPLAGGLLAYAPAAGAIEVGSPGEGGLGTIQQGFQEESNVNLAQELVNLIRAQRSLQANARALTTAEELWALSLYQPS
ncbi:MAG: flagellar hook-basal body protein [Dethiobacteria bacterium]